jgi:hypothetical protein
MNEAFPPSFMDVVHSIQGVQSEIAAGRISAIHGANRISTLIHDYIASSSFPTARKEEIQLVLNGFLPQQPQLQPPTTAVHPSSLLPTAPIYPTQYEFLSNILSATGHMHPLLFVLPPTMFGMFAGHQPNNGFFQPGSLLPFPQQQTWPIHNPPQHVLHGTHGTTAGAGTTAPNATAPNAAATVTAPTVAAPMSVRAGAATAWAAMTHLTSTPMTHHMTNATHCTATTATTVIFPTIASNPSMATTTVTRQPHWHAVRYTTMDDPAFIFAANSFENAIDQFNRRFKCSKMLQTFDPSVGGLEYTCSAHNNNMTKVAQCK